eukprot:365207-Chlamydomonas_euryale.AAC.1
MAGWSLLCAAACSLLCAAACSLSCAAAGSLSCAAAGSLSCAAAGSPICPLHITACARISRLRAAACSPICLMCLLFGTALFLVRRRAGALAVWSSVANVMWLPHGRLPSNAYRTLRTLRPAATPFTPHLLAFTLLVARATDCLSL